jgi:demethylspheroidene O-methyltransferase
MSNLADMCRRRWAALRNRLLLSARFRRAAMAFPPTRPIARRYAADLFDLTAGFVYAQVAAAMIESGLLAAIQKRAIADEEAALCAGLTPVGAATLLRAAASLRLVERIGAAWTLGPRGAALLASPGVADMIAHHRLLYADLADPLATLRGAGPGRLARLWRYGADADPADVAAYSRLMAASQPMVSEQAISAYPFRRHRRMLDIGGGEGAFVTAVASAAPGLHFGLLDLPAVIERARNRLSGAGLADRVDLHPGGFLDQPLPSGYDLLTLVRVLHDHDDAPALALLRVIRAALPSGGRLLIVEPMAGDGPAGLAYFGLYLAAMGSGRPRSPAEIREMLAAAGFARTRLRRTSLPLVARIIQADVS